MTYTESGERYSNDNHPEFPYGMKFMFNDIRYSIYRTDDIANKITVISKRGGHEYIRLGRLRELLEEGKVVRVEEE